MEDTFEVTDNINRLYGNISSSMQRIAQAYDSINYWQKYGDSGRSGRSVAQFTIDQENQNINSYNFKISENRIKLRELQDEQLELEKEKNSISIELAKLGQ